MSLAKEVAKIPGEEGWWKQAAEATYLGAAMELVKLGMSETDAVEFVASLYWAAADCYGH